MNAAQKFEALAHQVANMLSVEVIAVTAPSANRNGSIRVTSHEAALMLAAALSSSGIQAKAASHRAFHSVYL